MIDFSKTEEQELLIESIKELLEREMPAEKERECYRNGEFPWDAWKAMAEAGFTGLGLPEEVGGTDVDLMTVALANFTISRYGGPLAAFYSMGMPTMYDVCEFGTPEQIEKYVKPYIAGGAPLALGISEPSTGSDVAGMQTSYAWDGDTAVINGGKHYTTCGMEAPAIIVIAKDPTVDNVHRGATMFLVDRDTPGVTINKLPKMGHENAPTSICEVFLNDVRVPRSAILGVEHNGFMQTMANFTRERIANVSGVIATAVNAFEDACAYANQREQFGQQIGRFELVQEMIMEMSCKIENMMNMLYKLCCRPIRARTCASSPAWPSTTAPRPPAKWLTTPSRCWQVSAWWATIVWAVTTSTSAAPALPAVPTRSWCSTPLRRSSSATGKTTERARGGLTKASRPPRSTHMRKRAALAAAEGGE